MGDRDGGGGAAESYARKRQYDYNAVRVVTLVCVGGRAAGSWREKEREERMQRRRCRQKKGQCLEPLPLLSFPSFEPRHRFFL